MTFKNIFILIIAIAIFLPMNILYADQALKGILDERIAYSKKELSNAEKNLKYFTDINKLLEKVKINPAKNSKSAIKILLKAVEKRNFYEDSTGAIYAFFVENDPGFKNFIKKNTISFKINFPKKVLKSKFKDNFTLAMEKNGLRIIKKKSEFRIDFSMNIKDQAMPSYLSFSKMKSVRVTGTMRLVSRKGKLLASWEISKAAAHQDKESAKSQAIVKLVKLSVNKMLNFFLEEYAK